MSQSTLPYVFVIVSNKSALANMLSQKAKCSGSVNRMAPPHSPKGTSVERFLAL